MAKSQIPSLFLDKIYELSGGADKFKGAMILYFDKDGNPCPTFCIKNNYEIFALKELAGSFLSKLDEQSSFSSSDVEEDG